MHILLFLAHSITAENAGLNKKLTEGFTTIRDYQSTKIHSSVNGGKTDQKK